MILKSARNAAKLRNLTLLAVATMSMSRRAIKSSLAKTTETRLDVIKAGVTVCTAADSRSPA
nr:hypothetical protein [uncultured Campylobacter sp.]